MFQISTENRAVIYRRPTGRLMRPSDRMIATDGLGDLDGFLDVVKNFGSGVVKYMTAGIYDPTKNRFYVPFTGGQVRNWMQGITNTATLGLVKTDKFFGSQTMRTVGNIAAGVEAAAVAAVAGQYVSNKFFSPTSTTTTTVGGTTVKAPVSGITSGIALPKGTAIVGAAQPSTGSLFSLTNIADVAKKSMDVVSLGTKVMSAVGSGGGGGAPQPTAPMMQMPMEMYPSMGPMVQAPASVDQAMYMPQPMYGGMPGAFPSDMMMATGPGMMAMPGGGGGFGPPGSEFGPMDQMIAAQQEMQQGQVPGEITTGAKVVLAIGVGAIAYMIFVGFKKK